VAEAHRRLGELQAIRAGIVAGLTEWKNRSSQTTQPIKKSLDEDHGIYRDSRLCIATRMRTATPTVFFLIDKEKESTLMCIKDW
jgi:hypothetical protein